MGIYLNPKNRGFQESVNSQIYVDKTGLIEYTNECLNTKQKYLCVSRPRRFGKSMALEMLAAYYSCGCDSRDLFKGLKIRKKKSFQQHLNQYDVIYLNMQQFLIRARKQDMTEYMEQAVLEELRETYGELFSDRIVILAEALDKAHTEVSSILTYNDENSQSLENDLFDKDLGAAIGLAYYSARKDYKLVREFPAGKGFADIVFLPLPHTDKPALIVELKYDKTAETAIQQIKGRQYTQAFEGYRGEVVLVGVNYDRDNKEKPHSCVIEKIEAVM